MIYRYLIDPMLNSSHACAASLVNANEKVLDVACGNGTLAILIEAKTGSSVTGIDLDADKISVAKRFTQKRGIEKVNFHLMNATDLSTFGEKEFDTGVISMAMHQFTPAEGRKVLLEMKRVCKKIIIVDYAWPMNAGFYKWLTETIEWIAGGDHYRNFKQYMSNRGIDPLLNETGLTVKKRHLRGMNTIMISFCEA